MKIKMLASIAGVDYALSPGEETNRFEDAEAIRLIEAGFAEPVGEVEPERAEKKPRREKRR